MEKGRTAILYFAYRPKAEAQRKPIFSNHGLKTNIQFYYELQDSLYDRIVPLGLPVVHIDDRTQRGDSFAERISNAVEDVWAKGYERVIILGNDCPELKTPDYQRAIDLLDQDNSVVIPTQHGGAGLIALHKKQYNGEQWRNLDWQSESTFNELFDCLSSCKVIDITMNELNTLADVYSYLELHKHEDDALVFLIDSILNPLSKFIALEPKSFGASFELADKLRGPPFSA